MVALHRGRISRTCVFGLSGDPLELLVASYGMHHIAYTITSCIVTSCIISHVGYILLDVISDVMMYVFMIICCIML